MKIFNIITCLIVLIALQVSLVHAGAQDARQQWLEAKERTAELREEHNLAKSEYRQDKTPENEKKVVDTGKALLQAALDEAEAWLEWKKIEAEENPKVPSEIKESIASDVDANLAKIDSLRNDVDSVKNSLELGVTFLKMLKAHGELMVDVARNNGNMWIYIANDLVSKVEESEGKLRAAAEKADSKNALAKLDAAEQSIKRARENIDRADNMYDKVKLPGAPFINFNDGNVFLNAARTDLADAHRNMLDAFNILLRGE
ncbi:hypothetical protein J4457_00370 [Candidatus Woesearchaeota archaeon]|nr:hypothetical protein [Candidatus Woesearchaeota archaeon]